MNLDQEDVRRNAAMAVRTVLATKPDENGTEWALVHRTAGRNPMAPESRPFLFESWGCLFRLRDGLRAGQWYRTEAEARTAYDRKK